MDKPAIKRVLRDYSVKKLAEWYCRINMFLWPEDFPFPQPEGPRKEPPDSEEWQYMQSIEDLIGRKETLRWWNLDAFDCGLRVAVPLPDYYTGPTINTGRMSEDEFEKFWETSPYEYAEHEWLKR